MSPTKLNETAYEHARHLIEEGRAEADDRDDWSEHQPSTQEENLFIEEHGLRDYARWHLGIDDRHGEETKARYRFPYGDFERVHRCALLAIESRAGQYGHREIQLAAAHLHGRLDALARV